MKFHQVCNSILLKNTKILSTVINWRISLLQKRNMLMTVAIAFHSVLSEWLSICFYTDSFASLSVSDL